MPHNQRMIQPLHTLIVAAGKGSRFGSTIPKQYTSILGKTILEHSIDALSHSDYINDIVLVVAANDKKVNDLVFSIPSKLCIGGSERWQSVIAGVQCIIESGGKPDDLVLIHDAARPCIDVEQVDAVIEIARNEPYGAILGVPIADTIKRINAPAKSKQLNINDTPHHNNTVTVATILNTVDRSALWLAQTPQVYRLDALQQVLMNTLQSGLMITDEASAFEAMGLDIAIVNGSRQNIKLTYPDDLSLIETILASKKFK